MPDMLHVDSDLMGTAGFQRDFHERRLLAEEIAQREEDPRDELPEENRPRGLVDLSTDEAALAAEYHDELAVLTPQEQKILMLVAEGKTNKEIAAEVFLSDKTVKNYVSSILSKLNLQRRTQAAAFVAKHRLGDQSQ